MEIKCTLLLSILTEKSPKRYGLLRPILKILRFLMETSCKNSLLAASPKMCPFSYINGKIAKKIRLVKTNFENFKVSYGYLFLSSRICSSVQLTTFTKSGIIIPGTGRKNDKLE
jgi:hypothetical protein